MNKSYRQGQILKLIRTKKIHTQDELVRELKAMDVDANQVTLSRDIRELELVKTHDGYRQIMPEQQGPSFGDMASEFLIDIRAAQNTLVLKTSPAHASSVAVALDNEEWPEVVGTIAGDDTIFVVTPDAKTAGALRKKLISFSSRQAQILKLIATKKIYTQDELVRELKTIGVDVKQVTISRDIRELRLVKTQEGYRQILPEQQGPSLGDMAAEFLVDIRVAQNTVVLKTSPAHASSVAVALDKENWPEVVGTIAGDDTIFVVTPDAKTAESLRQKLLYFTAE